MSRAHRSARSAQPHRSAQLTSAARSDAGPGRHELGQNFLTDPRYARAIVDLAAVGDHPIVEWAAGDGSLTVPLARLGRALEAVEVDPRQVRRLRGRVPGHVRVTEMDILRHAPPAGTWTLVCNVPFHLTTPVLRRLLRLPGWDRAVLVTQWEVARKRAGVGGATQMTAEWWPWFTFSLEQRVPATAFTPRPSVDGGILVMERRRRALVEDRARYQAWVRSVFTGPGRGMPQILARAGLGSRTAHTWCRAQGLTAHHLPRDLDAEQWVAAFDLVDARSARPGSVV